MEPRIITLFADPTPSRRGPSGFLVSMAVHVVVMGSLYLNLKHRIRVEDEAIVQRYTVRLLSLWRPEPQMRRPAEHRSTQAPQGATSELASAGRPSAPSLPAAAQGSDSRAANAGAAGPSAQPAAPARNASSTHTDVVAGKQHGQADRTPSTAREDGG